ncbi:hypothetical protein ACFY9A_37485 [Streptomyces rubradiris]|uniref:hypothetical protein n=1 Tax=Streptomyces rubradiris TaxID=285531 RepID=UPI0036ED61EA
MLFTGACGGDTDKKATREPGTPVVANRVCDGAFDAPAAEALRRLAGTDRFDESAGAGEIGAAAAFSLTKAAQHLHDTYRQRSACWVYKTGDDSGEPLLEIRFSASQGYPSGTREESDTDEVTYPVGLFAQVGRNGADLFFQCSTKAPAEDAYIGDTKYVKAELFSPSGQMRGDSIDHDRMVILNSISRKLAQAAGCASEADLPATVSPR